MKSNKLAKFLVAVVATAGVIWSSMAIAIDWNITGFVRQEIGISISGQENQNNQMSDDFNGQIVPHYSSPHISPANANLPKRRLLGSPFTLGHAGLVGGNDLVSGAPNILQNPLTPIAEQSANSLTPTSTGLGTLAVGAAHGLPASIQASAYNCRFGNSNQRGFLGGGNTDPISSQAAINAGTAPGFFQSEGFFGVRCPNAAGNFQQPGSTFTPAGVNTQALSGQDDFDVTMFNTRAEVDVQARINRRLSAYMKVRAYFWGEDLFTDGRVGDHFSQKGMFHGDAGNILEVSGSDLLLDFPALYFDYNNGPLWVRVGQQTIAWGEAYFFRVMDVANGLDLRRQLVGVAAEEFSDQRVASPAVRLSYTFNNGYEIDAFAQMFSPTLLPGQNSPYNLIGHSATWDEEDEFEDAENSINFGFRLTAPITDNLTLMAMYTNRRDPNGVARYTDAPRVWNGQVNPFCLGPRNDTKQVLQRFGLFGTNARGTDLTALGVTPSDGSCGSPLAPDPWAANSTEVFTKVPEARLDPVKAVQVVVDEWEADRLATREAFGYAPERNFVDAISTVEGFHSSFGSFRSWITREFKREQIFAVGGNYIINSENEWLDQLIVRGEVAVTPDKKFTDLGLSKNFIEETEVVSALILEKYQRFSDAFPATYLVAQWMHRTSSDIFGRHLSGMEAPDLYEFLEADGVTLKGNALDDYEPDGQDNANYIAIALQQPFPNLIWRFDFAMLIDVQGGVLFQPGVRYRPSAKWQFDLYATVVEDLSSTKNDTVMESLDFNDEVFARITWFF